METSLMIWYEFQLFLLLRSWHVSLSHPLLMWPCKDQHESADLQIAKVCQTGPLFPRREESIDCTCIPCKLYHIILTIYVHVFIYSALTCNLVFILATHTHTSTHTHTQACTQTHTHIHTHLAIWCTCRTAAFNSISSLVLPFRKWTFITQI